MSDLPAGPELDRLVEEKVMGQEYDLCHRVNLSGEWIDSPGGTYIPVWGGYRPGYLPPGGYVGMTPPRRSTDIAAAWEVAEKVDLFGDWYDGRILWRDGKKWVIGTTGDAPVCSYPEASSESLPLAICRAALTAVGAR